MRLAKVAVAVTWMLGTAALADPPWQDQRRVEQDARTTWNDRDDLNRLRDIRARLDQGKAMRDWRLLKSVDWDLQNFMHQEWSEARFKLYKAHGNLEKDRRDVRVDDANARANYYQGRDYAANRDERQAYENRQDAHQDRRDLQNQRWNLDRVRDIAVQLNGLYNRYDYPALQRKSYLVGQLIRLTEEQLAQDHADMNQDRRDQWQDRHKGPPPPRY